MENDWPSINLEAHDLVRNARGKAYDHPAIDYGRTAALFESLTGVSLSIPEAVAFMLCVKLSRIGAAFDHGFPFSIVRDSVVDLAGYADYLAGVWDYETDAAFEDFLTEFDE